MKSNEIRVGNIICFEATAHVVREIHREIVLHTWAPSGGARYYSPYEEIDGFPLMLDWIPKLGFILREKVWVFQPPLENIGWRLSPSIVEDVWTLSRGDNEIALVRYIHEVQNIYFALTGEEIKIDL